MPGWLRPAETTAADCEKRSSNNFVASVWCQFVRLQPATSGTDARQTTLDILNEKDVFPKSQLKYD